MTLSAVRQSVVGILTHPEETKNKAVYLQSITISQNKLLDLVEEACPRQDTGTLICKFSGCI